MQDMVKGLITPGQIFEKLGFRYLGPIDGHDIGLLIKTLSQIKDLRGPLLLHVITHKGKGYKFAEENPTNFHGIGSFDKETGESNKLKKSLPYTKVFGESIVRLAETDSRICAITAAMTTGTGLTNFAKKFPNRFFDVGIAEQHGSTFAAGLAASGLKPFFAVYSTFLQRSFDQLIHDVALQKLSAVFCLDRAGIVGEDGPTHHGCFDISYLLQIPNMTVTAPRDGIELQKLMALAAMWQDGPFAIRYPRADVPEMTLASAIRPADYGVWEGLRDGDDLAILAVGSMVYPAWKAADILDKDGINATVINCSFLKPIDESMLDDILSKFGLIITIEEGSLIGGFGQYIGGIINGKGAEAIQLRNLGLPDHFIGHGKRSKLLEDAGLSVDGIASSVLEYHQAYRVAIANS
jgi:1-deoxy-D-xylulose-5-phosphate synthase